MPRKPTGFEGRPLSDWSAVISPGCDEDDPSFETVSQIARRTGIGPTTVSRWLRDNPKAYDMLTVRRPGIKCPVRVYRLK